MTFTGDSSSSGNENEIQYNRNGASSSDPKLTWESQNSTLLVTGKIEQKVSNLTLIGQYNLGTVAGITFQGGSLFVTSGSTLVKTDDKGKKLAEGTLSNAPVEVINDGVNIYTLTTSTNTLSVLDQSLVTTNIVTDPINLISPTRFVRFGRFLFICCGSKLSRFDTSTLSVDNSLDIGGDTFVDVAVKGDTIVCLRNASVTEVNPETMQLLKNVPSSNIVNPRRIAATRDNVFVLTNNSILTFNSSLGYIGRTTSGLTDSRTISLYGSFIIVSRNTGDISIFDASNIPATLIGTLTVQV